MCAKVQGGGGKVEAVSRKVQFGMVGRQVR